MSAQRVLHKDAMTFCKVHLGRNCFAPFTGQDWPAWIAFVYLLQCYGCGGGEACIAAMRATVACAQPKVRDLFVQAIPAALDWGFVEQIWPKLVDGDDRNMTAVCDAT